jgi:L-fucose isomerase-like protein
MAAGGNGRKVCFGLIVGNRGFFPDALALEGYDTMTALLARLGYDVVVLGQNDTKYGAVETWDDSKKCAELFKKNRDRATASTA